MVADNYQLAPYQRRQEKGGFQENPLGRGKRTL